MSRMIFRGKHLEEMSLPELSSAAQEIKSFADGQNVTDELYQLYWGDDLREIAAEISGRERPN